MDNDICRTCGKRVLCSSLCPEAEAYVNQDCVWQRELTIGRPRTGRWPNLLRPVKALSPRERELVGEILQKKSAKQIMKRMNITRKTYDETLRNIRGKYRENYPVGGDR